MVIFMSFDRCQALFDLHLLGGDADFGSQPPDGNCHSTRPRDVPGEGKIMDNKHNKIQNP